MAQHKEQEMVWCFIAPIKVTVLIVILIGAIFSGVSSYLTAQYAEYKLNLKWQEKCVDMGVAEYSKKTGKWRLKPEFREELGKQKEE